MCVCERETHPEGFEGLCVGQELEERGGGEQQEGPVDGLSALQTRQRELVEAVARLVSHSRLKTTTTTRLIRPVLFFCGVHSGEGVFEYELRLCNARVPITGTRKGCRFKSISIRLFVFA